MTDMAGSSQSAGNVAAAQEPLDEDIIEQLAALLDANADRPADISRARQLGPATVQQLVQQRGRQVYDGSHPAIRTWAARFDLRTSKEPSAAAQRDSMTPQQLFVLHLESSDAVLDEAVAASTAATQHARPNKEEKRKQRELFTDGTVRQVPRSSAALRLLLAEGSVQPSAANVEAVLDTAGADSCRSEIKGLLDSIRAAMDGPWLQLKKRRAALVEELEEAQQAGTADADFMRHFAVAAARVAVDAAAALPESKRAACKRFWQLYSLADARKAQMAAQYHIECENGTTATVNGAELRGLRGRDAGNGIQADTRASGAAGGRASGEKHGGRHFHTVATDEQLEQFRQQPGGWKLPPGTTKAELGQAQAKLNLHRDDVSPEAQRLVLPDGHDAAPLKGKALLPADQCKHMDKEVAKMRTEGTAAVNNVINAMWTKFGTAARALTMKQWRAQVRSAGRRFMAQQKKKAAEGEAHIAPRAVQKAQKEEERKRKRKGEKIVSVKKLTKAR